MNRAEPGAERQNERRPGDRRRLKQQFASAAQEIESLAFAHAGDFKSFEQELVRAVWALARVAMALFFAHRYERCVIPARLERAGRTFRPAPAQPRNLNTFFGVVRYWRTYLREVTQGERRGLYPLDEELGLTGDRVSFGLLVVAARLALKLSFAEARSTLGLFVPARLDEVIEHTSTVRERDLRWRSRGSVRDARSGPWA